jgi:hypothetical protein
LYNKVLIPWWYKHAWLGVGHPNDPTSGLNGGPSGKFLPGELPLSESPCCPPFDG